MAVTPAPSTGTVALPPWIGRSEPSSPLAAMPQLGEAMSAAAAAWSDIFGQFSGSPTEIEVRELAIVPLETIVARRGPDSIFAVVLAPDWDGALALNFDRAFVTTMVDALFGGGAEAGLEADMSAPLSSVEQQIAAIMATEVSDALAAGFAPLLPTTFRFDRFLAKLDLGFLGKPGTSVLVSTFAAQIMGRTIHLDALLPLPLLEPFADQLAAPAAVTASTGIDPRWSRQLETEVGRAMTTLRAAIDMPPMSLGAIARLSTGQVLHLPMDARGKVRLSCADDDLFRCDLGQSAGFYTVRIEDGRGLDCLPISEPITEVAHP